MFAWQIVNPKNIKKVNTTSNLEQLDDVKVAVTKCLITRQDILDFINGPTTDTPIVPSKIAVGKISETLEVSNYFTKSTNVYLSCERPCNNCYKCNIGESNECLSPKFATRDFDGFLREFAVVPKATAHIFPEKMSQYDALFIYHISLALSVIDKLKIEKGQHVCILGGSIFAVILAELVSYYQAVPIVVDSIKENLEIANKCGIYYTFLTDKSLEKNILNITGGRKCSKIVYITESELQTDWIDRLSATNADIGISGITDTKSKINFDGLYEKEVNIKFIRSGNSNIAAGINILVQKVLQLDKFDIPEYKFDYVNKHFENYAEKLLTDSERNEFIVDLIQIN